jgi:hypothetical protein
MIEDAMSKQTQRGQLARMNAALDELAANPKLPLIQRYESRLHLMYQRTLKNLLHLRKSLEPGPAVADLPNEPITPIAVNENVPANPEINPSKPISAADETS